MVQHFNPLHSSMVKISQQYKVYVGLSCFGVRKRHMTANNRRRVRSHPTHGGAPKQLTKKPPRTNVLYVLFKDTHFLALTGKILTPLEYYLERVYFLGH